MSNLLETGSRFSHGTRRLDELDEPHEAILAGANQVAQRPVPESTYIGPGQTKGLAHEYIRRSAGHVAQDLIPACPACHLGGARSGGCLARQTFRRAELSRVLSSAGGGRTSGFQGREPPGAGWPRRYRWPPPRACSPASRARGRDRGSRTTPPTTPFPSGSSRIPSAPPRAPTA